MYRDIKIAFSVISAFPGEMYMRPGDNWNVRTLLGPSSQVLL